MSAPLRIEAPTDAQIGFVARLCEERGFPMPPVCSKQDASILIDEIRTGLYWPAEWEGDDSDDDTPF